METVRIIVHYVFSLAMSIALVYATIVMLERQLESRLLGRPRSPRFINAFFRRVWIYWLLPGVFSFTGVGLVLFPNSRVQDALTRVTTEMLDKEGPYSQNVVTMLGLETGGMAVIGAIVASILLVALGRIVVVTYNSALATTIYFYFLGSMGIIGLMMTLDPAEKYVRLLVDYLLGDKFQTGLILVGVGSMIGFCTEWFLVNIPVRGWAVGQVPAAGAYVCKTCQRSQYMDGNSQLEHCPGRCTQPIFRRAG